MPRYIIEFHTDAANSSQAVQEFAALVRSGEAFALTVIDEEDRTADYTVTDSGPRLVSCADDFDSENDEDDQRSNGPRL